MCGIGLSSRNRPVEEVVVLVVVVSRNSSCGKKMLDDDDLFAHIGTCSSSCSLSIGGCRC